MVCDTSPPPIWHDAAMRFEPRAWQPPTDLGLTGAYAPNHRLTDADLWHTGGVGPEDVAIGADGRVMTGLADGRIIRFSDDGGTTELIGTVPGRPLGIEALGESLVVCDADTGLMQMQPDGETTTLAHSHNTVPFALTNNASVASDGTIYFTVSSHRWPLDRYRRDLMERTATGRLYRRDPRGEIDVVVDDLVFAAGVALSRREDFALVAEMGSYRILRVWLSGDRAGRSEVFAENLPGFPDNISRWHDTFWVALASLRDPTLDRLLPRPWLMHAMARMPRRSQPRPRRHGFVIGFDHGGRVVTTLQDPTGRVALTTGARADGFRLYVGSLTEPTIAVADLPTSFET